MSQRQTDARGQRPGILLFGAVMTLFGVSSLDFETSVWLAGHVVVRALSPLGFKDAAIRAALRRNAERGLFDVDRVGSEVRYRLSDHGRSLVTQGRTRVNDPEALIHSTSQWTLLTFPEGPALRNDRYQLNLRLAWAGFGRLMPNVWITPGTTDVTALLRDAFDGEPPVDAIGFSAAALDQALVPEMISRAWDLDAIRAEHVAFQNLWASPSLAAENPLADLVHLLNSWSTLLLADPGLPAESLPADWPAGTSTQVCTELKTRLWAPARDQLTALLSA